MFIERGIITTFRTVVAMSGEEVRGQDRKGTEVGASDGSDLTFWHGEWV